MLKKAAIFDLDGTLIPSKSAESTFFLHCILHRKLSFLNIMQMARQLFRVHGNWHELTRANKQYLRGKSVQTMVAISHEIFKPKIHNLVFPVMKTVIEQHRTSGDILLLLTGTLDFIADGFASALKFDGYKASTLEVKDHRFTGKLIGVQPFGIGKLEVLRDLRREFSFDQNSATLYANMYSDRYVMNAVEIPVAVNPDKTLRRYAEKNKWKIIHPKPGTW